MKPLIAAMVTAGLASGAYAENRIDTQRPDAPELAAYGELKVGVRTIEMTNPGQIDIVKIDPTQPKPGAFPTYDRSLTVEVWYPAAADATGETTYDVILRDGETTAPITGKAMRDAAPMADATYPFVIVSHGYPGNRYLMGHLAENLASKGYVVAAIDHRDSTYEDKTAFGSTLVNRPIDQKFVLNTVAELTKGNGFLAGLADTDNTGLIGYSMGGYGAVISAGGGVTEASVAYDWGGPHGTLGVHLSGSDTHNALPDPRIKTAVAIAPWGLTYGFWDAETLKGVKIPMMFVAGSVDDVSGYKPGVRSIWAGATGVDRSLLTYENANHNAAAPMPAPAESYAHSESLGWAPFAHYSDPVWDTVRMNNIAQHFVTAWLGKHLGGDGSMDAYLELVPSSNDAVWAIDKEGVVQEGHTYWKGFENRTAKGLKYEVLGAGEDLLEN